MVYFLNSPIKTFIDPFKEPLKGTYIPSLRGIGFSGYVGGLESELSTVVSRPL